MVYMQAREENYFLSVLQFYDSCDKLLINVEAIRTVFATLLDWKDCASFALAFVRYVNYRWACTYIHTYNDYTQITSIPIVNFGVTVISDVIEGFPFVRRLDARM